MDPRLICVLFIIGITGIIMGFYTSSFLVSSHIERDRTSRMHTTGKVGFFARRRHDRELRSEQNARLKEIKRKQSVRKKKEKLQSKIDRIENKDFKKRTKLLQKEEKREEKQRQREEKKKNMTATREEKKRAKAIRKNPLLDEKNRQSYMEMQFGEEDYKPFVNEMRSTQDEKYRYAGTLHEHKGKEGSDDGTE